MLIPYDARGVAQHGSAPALGAGGRPFKSARPDFAPVAQVDKSSGLLSRGSGVRVPSGAPRGARRGGGAVAAMIGFGNLGLRQDRDAGFARRYCLRGGECNSVGRAPGCGLGGRGFKSLHSPQTSCYETQFTHGGPLAQLVEQLTLNQRVSGSSPERPTKSPLIFQGIPRAGSHFLSALC